MRQNAIPTSVAAGAANPAPTVAAVIITRRRPDDLRRTIQAVLQSRYPISEIVVTDDSDTDDDSTGRMLAQEFSHVIWTRGPRRGIAANRNHGIATATADYILLLDDDILVDPNFVATAMEQVRLAPGAVFFPTMQEYGKPLLPNGLDFLGFSTRPYAPGQPYHTANCQCLVISRQLSLQEPWDEVVATYGYEEMDYAYRMAAARHPIVPLTQHTCVHLSPNPENAFRQGKDASRMYVTYKRYAFVDRKPLKAALFALVAGAHHLLAGFKRSRWTGVKQSWNNLRMTQRMLGQRRRTLAR